MIVHIDKDKHKVVGDINSLNLLVVTHMGTVHDMKSAKLHKNHIL